MKRWIGHKVFKIFGWRMGEEPPKLDQYVLIAAPHTTNWDLVFMMAYAWIHEMEIRFMGKHTLFYPPWGWFIRWLGGMPIDRRSNHKVVDQMVMLFDVHPKLILTIPAAGTRRKKEYWKSGFYHIAKEAKIPIIPGYLDYKEKVAGFGPPLQPTGDLSADMDVLRAFYATKTGKFPALTSRVRLRAEDEPAALPADTETATNKADTATTDTAPPPAAE